MKRKIWVKVFLIFVTVAIVSIILIHVSLRVSGHCSKKDIRTYLENKYDITSSKIYWNGSYDSVFDGFIWNVKTEKYPDFYVYESRHGFSSFRLFDTLDSSQLLLLYNDYDGEKDLFTVEKTDESVLSFSFVQAEYSSVKECEKCYRELQSFCIYLKENHYHSEKYYVDTKAGLLNVKVKILLDEEILKRSANNQTSFYCTVSDENLHELKDMSLQSMESYKLWDWIEGLRMNNKGDES